MRVRATTLPGVVLIEPTVHRDERGWFAESWHLGRYREAGLPDSFVQDNVSFSRRHVLRGLHFQEPDAQGKLVGVLRGEVFDVAVDVRVGSPTFGAWAAHTLSEENALQLYVPPGFAHGLMVTSDEALFHYKCTDYYRREVERTLLWDDPDIGISWPVRTPMLSAKDRAGSRLRDIPAEHLPHFSPAV